LSSAKNKNFHYVMNKTYPIFDGLQTTDAHNYLSFIINIDIIIHLTINLI